MSTRKTSRGLCRQELARDFARVPLGLKLLGGPLVPNNANIFQMDIHPSRRFGEYLRIWPGAPDNEIEVVAMDRSLRQVVLRVQEPRRPFTQQISRSFNTEQQALKRAADLGGRLLGHDGQSWSVQLWTPAEERRYLCGPDDVHLFIAQIRGGTTVAQAHAALLPRAVSQVNRRRPGSVQRQGEWFFVPLSARDIRTLDGQLASRPRAVKRRHPVGPGDRPHRADEVVRVDRRVRPDWRRHTGAVSFARGWVRHADHNPLYLPQWRQVVRNLEVGNTLEDRRRMRWID